MAPVDDALDLFAIVVGALDAAAGELLALGECGLPVPDAVEKLSREHAAMRATLARLPASLRERAVVVYREEFEQADPKEVELPVPLLDEPRMLIEEALERVRRGRLCSPALDRELYVRTGV